MQSRTIRAGLSRYAGTWRLTFGDLRPGDTEERSAQDSNSHPVPDFLFDIPDQAGVARDLVLFCSDVLGWRFRLRITQVQTFPMGTKILPVEMSTVPYVEERANEPMAWE
jgi:hypothetical protein